MAVTLQLTDGTTTHDLNGSTYAVRYGTFAPGNPGDIRSEASNIHRNGWDLKAWGFRKRVMSMDLLISSASLTAQSTNVQALNEALRKARDYQIHGIGSQWQLQVDYGSGVTVSFNVQNGALSQDPADLVMPFAFATVPEMLAAHLILETDPLGQGSEESILSYIADGSFEVAGTALADWTQNITATGSTARDTTQAKYGSASLKLEMTDSGGAAEFVERYQDIAAIASEVWSFSAWIYVTALSNARYIFLVEYLNAALAQLDFDQEEISAANSGFTQYTIENKTMPANTAWIRLHLRLRSYGAANTGTAYTDGVLAVKASSVPTTWVSGKDVVNHFDDDGQAHINYVDIYDVPGDYPALLQFKYSEKEAHTRFWAGARHRGRLDDAGLWHEGEDFDAWASEPADANASGGNYGRMGASAANPIQSSSSQGNSSATLTYAHDLSSHVAENDVMIVGVAMEDSPIGAASPTGVTFNGVALTKVDDQSSNDANASLWYLIDPDHVNANVVVTFAAAMQSITSGCVTFHGIDINDLVAHSAKASGNSTTPSVVVSSSERDLVIDVVAFRSSATSTEGAGQTKQWDENVVAVQTMHGAGSTETASGASTTMSWSMTGAATDWAIVALSMNAASASSPIYVVKTVSSPPTGTYRALIRTRKNSATENFGLAVGFSYGGVEYMPSLAGHYTTFTLADTNWQIVDIGSVQIPPAALPDGATIDDIDLRICFYRTEGNGTDNLDIDYLFLQPVDFGEGYAEKDIGTDVMVLDMISRTPMIGRWDTSDVFKERPPQTGKPPLVDPDGTRIYTLVDNYDDGSGDADITDGGAVEVRVIPQYLHIG